jgi:hypothetical protein
MGRGASLLHPNAESVGTRNPVFLKVGKNDELLLYYLRHHSNSPARHSRVYVHADKFENLRFKSWRENCSENTEGIQETTNTRELWLNPTYAADT